MKLKIGCMDRLSGYTHVDIDPLKKPDIVSDVQNMKSIEDNSVNEMIVDHVLEHVPDTLAVFTEVFRVMKNQGIVKIITPHADNPDFYGTPDHIKPFIELTFRQLRSYNGYHFDFIPLKIKTHHIYNRRFPFRHKNFIEAELKVVKN